MSCSSTRYRRPVSASSPRRICGASSRGTRCRRERRAVAGDEAGAIMAVAAVRIAQTLAGRGVDDTLTAVDYRRSHAFDLRIDMNCLGLIGSSAGAITTDHVG